MMNQNTLRAVSVFVCFLLASITPLAAQWERPFPSPRVITTEHFEIIFPAESEKTARTLAGFADRVYSEITGLLDNEVPGRIPVSITPGQDNFNSYANAMPYPHIVLFDTPMPIEDMAAYTNSLEGLFRHELTHIVAMTIRSSRLENLYNAFGGWVLPVLLYNWGFMAEGVTVSFESLDGAGRARDPLFRSKLIQAVHENAFLTPYQTETYDLPHIANGSYIYGGYFSAWLQERYGMDKYAQLWAAMGKLKIRITFDIYKDEVFGLFLDVYGRYFPEVWEEFMQSLRIEGIEENPEPPLYSGASGNPRNPSAWIAALGAGGGKVFAADSISGKLLVFEPRQPGAGGQKIPRELMDAPRSSYYLSASPDGGTFMLSYYRYAGSLNLYSTEERAVVTEYDARGRKTGREWKGLYRGSGFRDGAIGLAADTHNTSIVYRPALGGEEVLLQGTEELLYSNPAALDNTWIAFTAAKRGTRELCLYNYETRQVYTLTAEGAGLWKYMRGLGFYEGRLLFSYNEDGRLYKLGAADLRDFLSKPDAAVHAVFSEKDYSGGVFLPVMAGGEVYYAGAFASRHALMKFPEQPWGRELSLSLKPWALEERQAAGLEGPKISGPLESGPQGTLAPPSSRYLGLRYFNPFKFWLPYPLLRFDDSVRYSLTLNGAGIFTNMADPTDTNNITLSAAMDVPYLMLDSSITWRNAGMGFPLTFTLGDQLDTIRTRYSGAVRDTSLSVNAVFRRSPGKGRVYFSASPELQVKMSAFQPQSQFVWKDGPESAYLWGYSEPFYTAGLGLSFGSLLGKRSWELFGRGADFTVWGRYALRHGLPLQDQALPRAEGIFTAASERSLPVRLRLYGAWDERGMNLAGQSEPFESPAFKDFSSIEYASGNDRITDLKWLAGGEAEFQLFKVEVQKNYNYLYINRIFSTLAYRGVVYDDGGHPNAEGAALPGPYRLAQSLVLRLGTTVLGGLTPSLLGIWKISSLRDGGVRNNFSLGFTLQLPASL
jgi:hypothetical protein